MADFYKSIDFILDNEGGLVDNPHDKGGVTNFGLSQKSYPDLDIRNLTRDQAKEIYKRDFWKFDEIQDLTIATKLLDLTVNMGLGAAVRLVQRALGAPQDSVLGPTTLKLINVHDPVKLLLEIKARQCEFYARIVLNNSSQADFLLGWLRRAVKP